MKTSLHPELLLRLSGLTGCYWERYPSGSFQTMMYYQAPGRVYAQTLPPPVRVSVETQPPMPSAQSVWVAGYWHWQGQTWVWIDGHWDTPRGPGYAWTDPVCAPLASGGCHYYAG